MLEEVLQSLVNSSSYVYEMLSGLSLIKKGVIRLKP
jgi:hypothetical protein